MWSSAAGAGPRKRAELSLAVGEVHQSASKCPQKHRAGWSFRNETFSRASRSWALLPLKNRNRSYAGSALPEDYARRTVTKAQVQLIQSNCPSTTKNLSAVARRRVSDREELSVLSPGFDAFLHGRRKQTQPSRDTEGGTPPRSPRESYSGYRHSIARRSIFAGQCRLRHQKAGTDKEVHVTSIWSEWLYRKEW